MCLKITGKLLNGHHKNHHLSELKVFIINFNIMLSPISFHYQMGYRSSDPADGQTPGRPPLPTTYRDQIVQELAGTKTPGTQEDMLTSTERMQRRHEMEPLVFQYPDVRDTREDGWRGSQQQVRQWWMIVGFRYLGSHNDWKTWKIKWLWKSHGTEEIGKKSGNFTNFASNFDEICALLFELRI